MFTTATTFVEPRTDAGRSLVERDEYGPITGRPGGLLTAPTLPLALGERDELGRRLAAWIPDGDLL